MITVRFSCPRCGLKDEPVSVPARKKGEDLPLWINQVVMPRILRHHGVKALLCDTIQFCDVKLPCGDGGDPDAWVGKQTAEGAAAEEGGCRGK